jgi:hypothetical protein
MRDMVPDDACSLVVSIEQIHKHFRYRRGVMRHYYYIYYHPKYWSLTRM